MKLSAILLLVGVAILGYAYSMAPYTDETLFMERYMALSVGQSAEYWLLRDDTTKGVSFVNYFSSESYRS